MPHRYDTTADPAISVIITAHREGMIAGATIRSARSAIARAREADLACEIIVVLDRADFTTADLFRGALDGTARLLETDEGDPGIARNHGIAAARGRCATFLDADDLWSENWLVAAWQLIEARPDCVVHSAANFVFGRRRLLWWHIDSESALFDPDYLEWFNYWDSMSFARTALYRRYPFRRNDLALGFGHEDWHWNLLTHRSGIPHKPAPGTLHFKRARTGSQSEAVERQHGVCWPVPRVVTGCQTLPSIT